LLGRVPERHAALELPPLGLSILGELGQGLPRSFQAPAERPAEISCRELPRGREDGRRQQVQLTKAGHALLEQILPVWEALRLTMEELVAGDPESAHILPAISGLEKSFRSASLSGKIGAKLKGGKA